MWKFIMDYYGAECYRSIQKKHRIDNMIISSQVTLLFFIFNFQTIFYLLLIISKAIFKISLFWDFYMTYIYEVMIFFGVFSLASFVAVYAYVQINKIDTKINLYDYKDKVRFYNWYGTISGILMMVTFIITYNMTDPLPK